MKGMSILMGLLIVSAFFADLPAAAKESDTFKEEELDQMLAPIALYPDSLLAQVLMAATYPADVVEAAKWSKANPDQQGDAAVNAVADQPWDPSVKSLVAFPQVLAMMSAKPDDVQRLGDAFLAQPAQVMDRVQLLRNKAQEAGNLETNEQQNVSTQTDSGQSVIIIEPAQPQTVYVPVYQPTVVYGAWWYPVYPPYYWAPPRYYYPGGAFVAGVVWGAAIVGIHNGLWGGCNWRRGHGSVNINVNRYNNINVNNRINNVNKGNTNWNHNAANRKGVPYRDDKTRQQYDRKVAGADNRADYRGRDPQRDASREKAQATLADRGIDPAKGREQLRNDPQTRERAQTAAKNGGRDKTRAAAQNIDRDKSQAKAQNVDRDRARQNTQARSRDNALKGADNPGRSRQNINRGNASRQSMQRHGGGRRRG
ncbi:DUF3300 domain-containing protein [Desulfosarcina sp.]|uniref:DUF3300 domain-containing protein n=1 Tax=Desulfosarcina sp. TaxID=2027861 RepID=UPI0029ADE9D9|nr:DUF3300 domain-containing protein [Desulfosarcina sp.]MDX2455130.1 DUF3300 domain-containing protein [Desulfosarcina sp.]